MLLLGASGFIGRHVRPGLLAAGHEVISVSRQPAPVEPGAEWRFGDLCDAAFVNETIAAVRPAMIVNCAGANSGSEADMLRANVLPIRHLRDALSDLDPVLVVHLGSAVEYGQVPIGVSVLESRAAQPIGAYGRAKLKATQSALALPPPGRSIVLRLFNVLGPGVGTGSVIQSAISAIRQAQLEGSEVIRLGLLDAYRDFVHVSDVADAVVAAVGVVDISGRIINVGSGKATLIRDVVTRIADLAGFHGRVLELASHGSPRSEMIPWLEADISLAASTLGWRPTRTLDEGLLDAWGGATSQRAAG